MKTRVFKFSGVLSLIMLVVGAVSCGSSMPSPKDVAEKIESHDVLAESDYTTMIDYCGEYAKKLRSISISSIRRPTPCRQRACRPLLTWPSSMESIAILTCSAIFWTIPRNAFSGRIMSGRWRNLPNMRHFLFLKGRSLIS